MEGKGRDALNLTEVMARDTETSGALFVLEKLIAEIRERLAAEHEAYTACSGYPKALAAHAIKRGEVTLGRLSFVHHELTIFEEEVEKRSPLYVDPADYPTDLEPYE
jgi:hypothetical protein